MRNLILGRFFTATIYLLALLGWCTLYLEPRGVLAEVPGSPLEVKVIGEGQQVPSAIIRDMEGNQIDFHTVLNREPVVLIFYRGGWCPYCNTHLGQLAEVQDELKELGYRLVAVSPDRPEKLKESQTKNNLGYSLYSDSKMELAKAFGVAFKLDHETVRKYLEEYKIDIEGDSGETHHLLPVPAVFVIDYRGKVRFRYYNADYKVRIDAQQLVKVANEVRQK
ncbi:MAG: AhpC/TSA family protein [Bdellovibrionales bacterium]|nr:AhpC/TSA family protein [Bdellovibrionales bacterium]